MTQQDGVPYTDYRARYFFSPLSRERKNTPTVIPGNGAAPFSKGEKEMVSSAVASNRRGANSKSKVFVRRIQSYLLFHVVREKLKYS